MREERAWAAGFFDGEGCTSRTWDKRSGRKYPLLAIFQNDPRPLERFRRAIGDGSVRGPHHPPSRVGKAQPRWVYNLFGKAPVMAALNALWPNLSEAKKDQAVRVFLECDLSRKDRINAS